MSFPLILIIGAAVGAIASQLMKVETNFVTTVGLGMGGALCGALVLNSLLRAIGVAVDLIGVVAGALLLIQMWQNSTSR